MTKLAAIYSGIGILVIFATMYRGVAYRRIGILNLRNIFLLGFVYFQLYGSIYPLWTGDYGDYAVLTPSYAASYWIAYSLLFLLCFYFSYEKVISSLETKLSQPIFVGGQTFAALLSLAVFLSIAAYLGRFSSYVPLFGPLLNHCLTALAASAGGLATFVLIRNFANPVLALPAIVAIGIGLLNTLLADFGRRGLVGLLGAVIWCGYFSRAILLTPRAVLFKVAPVLLAAMVLVGAFSQIRGDRDLVGDATARSGAIIEKFGVDALLSLFAIPDTGIASLWLIDSRRQDIATEHFFAARYFFLHFVPRDFMPDKPEPLSRRIPIEADKKGVALGVHTVGPGIVGHAAADGGLPAAALYGLVIGTFLGVFDRLLARNMHAPLAIAAIGCSLGQVLGLARGDSSIFLGVILVGIAFNLCLFWLLDKVTGQPNLVHSG